MASRKTQEKLAKATKKLAPIPDAPEEQPGELNAGFAIDEQQRAAEQKAFEEAMRAAQERQVKAEAEAKARYDRQVEASDRFTRAVEKLADALEHVAVRIAFDHGVKQAEAKPTRAERADPPPKAAAKPEPKSAALVEGPTADDVREAVRAAVKAGKGHEAVELLAKFKAESVSDLKPADFPAVFEALRKLLG